LGGEGAGSAAPSAVDLDRKESPDIFATVTASAHPDQLTGALLLCTRVHIVVHTHGAGARQVPGLPCFGLQLRTTTHGSDLTSLFLAPFAFCRHWTWQGTTPQTEGQGKTACSLLLHPPHSSSSHVPPCLEAAPRA
jgi:hypothetical protein